MTGLEEIKTMDTSDYNNAMKNIDKVIKLTIESLKLKHQLKFSLYREHMVKIHDNKHWADKMPKNEARELFTEFLTLYQNAYGKKFDNFQFTTWTNHFENWKAFMKWDYKKIKAEKK